MKKLLVPLLALLVILVAIGCDSDSQADEKNVLVIAQPTDVQTFESSECIPHPYRHNTV